MTITVYVVSFGSCNPEGIRCPIVYVAGIVYKPSSVAHVGRVSVGQRFVAALLDSTWILDWIMAWPSKRGPNLESTILLT